eukprot:3941019-Rhodomonas_salina.4
MLRTKHARKGAHTDAGTHGASPGLGGVRRGPAATSSSLAASSHASSSSTASPFHLHAARM